MSKLGFGFRVSGFGTLALLFVAMGFVLAAPACPDPQPDAQPVAQPVAQPAMPPPWHKEIVRLFATLPVQDEGRVKPLDTFANV